jgi:hypothetical protein
MIRDQEKQIKISHSSRFTGDHCLDKIGFIDHIIMDTLDKPANKNEEKEKITENQA